MNITLSQGDVSSRCEAILRSLPDWFGIEESLLEYVRDSVLHPTWVAQDTDGPAFGFITLREHFPSSFEVHCLAVHADRRRSGCGLALMQASEAWAKTRGARFMQVKTIAAGHPSLAYAETRAFYERVGYLPLEVFPDLWHPRNPCLQLIKAL
ncbi:GNAT family N-acetyltransferase [Ideonella azotifigens]|uniref:GNAT family N-acetyltransferase n=1 Tax=Ideonella azotifigens TaxID=513160 RepID=A0ABN1JJM0_9BURK|nr:GNAT family N-acetyltransferase [Ideonella azotifigens]MCD2341939.1 GNAT family N-acetyltransferase [Ideonella azotifigens]